MGPKLAIPVVSRAKLIERILGVDSQQVCTQTDPEDFPEPQQDINAKEVSSLSEIQESLSFCRWNG